MTILKATKDDAKAILTPFEQGVGEGDWRRYQARVKGHGKVLSVDAVQTTNTTLVVDELVVLEGDQLYLQEGLDTAVKSVIAGAVANAQEIDISSAGFTDAPTRAVLKAPSIGICLEDAVERCISRDLILGVSSTDLSTMTSTLPSIGADSSLAFYPMHLNAKDASGNYNGTWTGTEQYSLINNRYIASFNGSSYITLPVDMSQVAGVSLFFEWDGLSPSPLLSTRSTADGGFQVHVNSNTSLRIQSHISGKQYLYTIPQITTTGLHSVIVNIVDGQDYPQVYFDGIDITATRTLSFSATPSSASFLWVGRGYQDSVVYSESNVGYIRLSSNPFLQNEIAGISSEFYYAKDCLDVGDNIVLTVDGSLVTTEILTIDKSTPNQYTITFVPQPAPPTACTVLSRAVAQTNPAPVGDWDGDNMTLEYDAVLKQGRALEISVQGDNTYEVSQVNVDLYKEVI